MLENMSESDEPVLIIQPEFMRRMKDMSALGGGNPFGDSMPDHFNLVVNTNHPLVGKVLAEPDGELQKKLAKQLTDLARLAQNQLKGEELTAFIRRSVDMM
jgi:molecular chaperone HtpG